jgi:hypothetical protein
MTKVIIDINDDSTDPDEKCQLFRTKKDWDASYYSTAALNARIQTELREIRQLGYQRSSRSPHEIASSEPERFPCIAFRGQQHYKSNGPDEIEYIFIYDFKETT